MCRVAAASCTKEECRDVGAACQVPDCTSLSRVLQTDPVPALPYAAAACTGDECCVAGAAAGTTSRSTAAPSEGPPVELDRGAIIENVTTRPAAVGVGDSTSRLGIANEVEVFICLFGDTQILFCCRFSLVFFFIDRSKR